MTYPTLNGKQKTDLVVEKLEELRNSPDKRHILDDIEKANQKLEQVISLKMKTGASISSLDTQAIFNEIMQEKENEKRVEKSDKTSDSTGLALKDELKKLTGNVRHGEMIKAYKVAVAQLQRMEQRESAMQSPNMETEAR